MKKTITIEKFDNNARGLTRIEGKITFVPKTLPEELVEIEITKSEKKYNEARAAKILEPSSKRIEAKCPYYDFCGGCDLLHLDYEDAIIYKQNMLQELFNKNNFNIKVDFISGDQFNYRNKITLKIKSGICGYYQDNTHNLVAIKSCLIAKQSINDFIDDIECLNITSGEVTIRSNYNDELLIIIECEEEIQLDIGALKNKHKIVGIIQNDKCIYGDDHFIEKIGDYFFQVSYDSFFQINDHICNEIFKLIDKYVENENVLDLYCGVGTLGIIAAKKSKSVIGIEIVPNAIKNALVNKKMNKVDNVDFVLDNTNTAISKIKKDSDCIILDPPRSGLDIKTREYVLNSKAKKIIYISCNPNTLLRDLKELKNYYDIKEVIGLDMFPNTAHVEVITLLKLSSGECKL